MVLLKEQHDVAVKEITARTSSRANNRHFCSIVVPTVPHSHTTTLHTNTHYCRLRVSSTALRLSPHPPSPLRLRSVGRCPDVEIRGAKVPIIQGAAWGVRRRAPKVQGQVARAGAVDAGMLFSESTAGEDKLCFALELFLCIFLIGLQHVLLSDDLPTFACIKPR